MFFNTTIAVTRHLIGRYNNDGEFVPGASSTYNIKANVQPLNQRELEQYTHILPGGNRTTTLVKIYTDSVLITDLQTANQSADVVTWNNRDFKIVMVEEWQSGIISHYRYIGQELILHDNY